MSDVTVRTQKFFGLNQKPFSEEGEMIDMKNLSSDAFPYIKPRKSRDEYKEYFTVNAKAGEGKYVSDVDVLPDPDSVNNGDVYRLNPEGINMVPGGIFKVINGAWVRQERGHYIARSSVLVQNSYTLNGNLRTDVYKSLWNGDTYSKDYTLVEEYIKSYKSYIFLKYLGETTEEFTYGKSYKYKIDILGYEWERATGSYSLSGRINEMPSADSSNCGKIYRYTGETTDEFIKNGDYRCVRYIKGCWEETEEEPYEIVFDEIEPTEEGKTIRYCGEINTPVYDGRYTIDKDYSREGSIFFYELIEKSDNEVDVAVLPEPSEEIYGNIYRYTTPSKYGFYICKENEGKKCWEVCGTPVITKNLSINEYISGYSKEIGLEKFSVKKVLNIHGHNGKLAVLMEDEEGNTALYYDYRLVTILASDKTRMLSMSNKIMLGDGNAYYDTKQKAKKEGAEAFNLSLYGLRYSKRYNGGYGDVHVLFESYITSTEIVLYSNNEEYFKSALEIFNASNIDFEIKTDLSQGWEYATTSGPATLDYPEYGFKWGEDDWKKVGRWKLTIPVQKMLFPPQICKNNDGVGEGWVYLRKTAKNSRFLWKNRLWGYDENNLISSILGVLDEKGNINWDTVADGRNDNGAYTLPFMMGGDVTGIAALRDYITVFKRNHLCTLSGNTSATFLMNTISAFGLAEENERSIAVCGNTAFYMSDDGVYTFSGDYPVLISEKIKLEGKPVAAAVDNRFYYLSLEKDGVYTNYRYDILKGIWYKMNNTHIRQYCQLNGKMLYIDADTEKIMTIGENEKVEWEAVLTFDEGTWRKKKYKEFAIYGEFDEVDILAAADDSEEKAICHTKTQGKFAIMPITCEKLTIKICGRGEAIIKGFERKYEVL